MMTIKILGTGCAKCQNLTEMTKEVVAQNNLDATVEKVEDIMQIMEFNVMATPALVVNETVVLKGRIPSKEELLALIQSETTSSASNTSGCCCGPEGNC